MEQANNVATKRGHGNLIELWSVVIRGHSMIVEEEVFTKGFLNGNIIWQTYRLDSLAASYEQGLRMSIHLYMNKF